MNKFHYLAGSDITVGKSSTEVGAKVNQFFALPGVSEIVFMAQVGVAIWIAFLLGGHSIKALMKRDWKGFSLNLIGLVAALYVIVKFKLVLTLVFAIPDLFSGS